MRYRVSPLAIVFCLLSSVAIAVDAPAAKQAAKPDAPAGPWVTDKVMVDGVAREVRKAGIQAVAPHVADLETALAGAKHSFERAASGDGGTITVLVDDRKMNEAPPPAADKTKKVVVAVNPYLEIGYFLATYYDQSGKPDAALRTIDTALALPGSDQNSHRSELVVERAAALRALKRWPEALSAYDEALKAEGTVASIHAYMLRSRAMVLYELGRKQEATEDFREAAKLVADDQHAQIELQYIERTRDGGIKVPPDIEEKLKEAPPGTKPANAKPADAQPADPTTPPKS
ncbi:MAG: tetratricopeptide repeat protein [Rhizomicrobium sp.]